jgi:hypothetical protein
LIGDIEIDIVQFVVWTSDEGPETYQGPTVIPFVCNMMALSDPGWAFKPALVKGLKQNEG